MNRFFIFILATIITCSSCKKEEDKCSRDPCSSKAPDSEIQQIETYLAANSITAVKHCSGIYYVISDSGRGLAPTSCSAVSVTYKGSLLNGNVFDKATVPVAFSLVTLIEGWKLGLPLIKTGGKIRLFIPPSLGYGAAANGSIPANSVLIFDIDLLEVR